MADDQNTKDALLDWAIKSLQKARDVGNLNSVQLNLCFSEAKKVINSGGFRGDISDKWAEMGFTTLDIPDMYV